MKASETLWNWLSKLITSKDKIEEKERADRLCKLLTEEASYHLGRTNVSEADLEGVVNRTKEESKEL